MSAFCKRRLCEVGCHIKNVSFLNFFEVQVPQSSHSLDDGGGK